MVTSASVSLTRGSQGGGTRPSRASPDPSGSTTMLSWSPNTSTPRAGSSNTILYNVPPLFFLLPRFPATRTPLCSIANPLGEISQVPPIGRPGPRCRRGKLCNFEIPACCLPCSRCSPALPVTSRYGPCCIPFTPARCPARPHDSRLLYPTLSRAAYIPLSAYPGICLLELFAGSRGVPCCSVLNRGSKPPKLGITPSVSKG